jgi:hypothetical protein
MELVQRWWNGKWGRLARRDVWLEQDSTWHVHARQGGVDSPTKDKTWTFANRAEADDMVRRLLAAEPTDDWRDITEISAKPPIRDQIDRAPNPNEGANRGRPAVEGCSEPGSSVHNRQAP